MRDFDSSRVVVLPEDSHYLANRWENQSAVVFAAEHNSEQPAFMKLKVLCERDMIKDDIARAIIEDSFPYASSLRFIQEKGDPDEEIHGPARKGHHVKGDNRFGFKDLVDCLKFPVWPTVPSDFLKRKRTT